MLKFKKEFIDEWREKFVKREYPKKIARLDNRSIDYFVLPKTIFQGVPNGLFRMTGDYNDGYLIGVSQEVPEIVQPHFALSEHNEFMTYGLTDQNRTLHSEQNMLNILKDEKLVIPIYLNNKLILYEYILAHSRNNMEDWVFTQQDYQGFQRAFEFLKSEK